MFDHESSIRALGLIVFGAPVVLLCLLGAPALVGRPLAERITGRLCHAAVLSGLVPAAAILALMLAHGTRREPVHLGDWVVVPHYHFSMKLVFDRLSVPFVILTLILCGTIAAFGTRYLHHERGYNRFFVLYALFMVGMVTATLAGTIETLFTGWELVGLSSALLVAFFQERPAPPRNGLRVWVVYRVSDAALLLAAILMHHLTGQGDFEKLMGTGPWPEGHASVTEAEALMVGLLLLATAAGKSALVPFSGWLPRAMEGPTPSSAIFYGALSVHLGAFLLLRASPILEASSWLSAVVVALGLITAVYAYVTGSVQTDIKSALSFASLAQVGLIVAEIGIGLRYIPLVHLLGHACLRTFQFVRAPTLLHDYHLLESALGGHLPEAGGPLDRITSGRLRRWIYRLALERGYLDAILNAYVVGPFVRVMGWFDAAERAWTDFLTGRASRQTEAIEQAADRIEELS